MRATERFKCKHEIVVVTWVPRCGTYDLGLQTQEEICQSFQDVVESIYPFQCPLSMCWRIKPLSKVDYRFPFFTLFPFDDRREDAKEAAVFLKSYHNWSWGRTEHIEKKEFGFEFTSSDPSAAWIVFQHICIIKDLIEETYLKTNLREIAEVMSLVETSMQNFMTTRLYTNLKNHGDICTNAIRENIDCVKNLKYFRKKLHPDDILLAFYHLYEYEEEVYVKLKKNRDFLFIVYMGLKKRISEKWFHIQLRHCISTIRGIPCISKNCTQPEFLKVLLSFAEDQILNDIEKAYLLFVIGSKMLHVPRTGANQMFNYILNSMPSTNRIGKLVKTLINFDVKFLANMISAHLCFASIEPYDCSSVNSLSYLYEWVLSCSDVERQLSQD